MPSITRPSPVPKRLTLDTGLWGLQWLAAVLFFFSGGLKVLQPMSDLARTMDWVLELPAPMVRGIGAVELLGALGLVLPGVTKVLPRLTAYAAAGLTLVMVLALGFHLTRGEATLIPVTFALGGMTAFIAWGRFVRAPLESE